jgi:hypothetical protein
MSAGPANGAPLLHLGIIGYRAAPLAESVTVLDRSRVGDPVYDIGRFTPARFAAEGVAS